MEIVQQRLEWLEGELKDLRREIMLIKGESISKKNDWKSNTVRDYMIKVVYPGIFCMINEPKAAFPKNKRRIAEQIELGQYMFIYVTSPEKRIIGMTKITLKMKEVGGRWPYSVELDWVIGPKAGVTLKEAGLDIRPRVGDTLFGLSDETAQEIISLLNEQDDLDQNTLDYLEGKYKKYLDIKS